MTKYLIVKCEELSDQYECDADRTPMVLVDDWKKWYQENDPTYRFEVYKFDGEEFTLEKTYEESVEYGMALYFWDAKEEDHELVAPHVIATFKNYNRKSPIPQKVWSVFRRGAYWSDDTEKTETEFKEDLKFQGFVSWDNKDHTKWWVYGDYEDGRYCLGY